jgi:hypothetical protein
VAFGHVGVWKRVDSTCRAIELALAMEANEILPRKSDSLDVSGPNDTVFADILRNLLKRCCPVWSQYVIT